MSVSPGSQPHESPMYGDLAGLYEPLFRWVFYPRIATVVRSIKFEPGARVLEVGVGTGLSLDAYPPHATVVGIDLAEDMLAKAQSKIDQNGWRNIQVRPGDAQNLAFPDDSFDYVMAYHVVSVVPEPLRMMAEMHRVCRPGGTIVLINHFRSDNPILAAFFRTVDPVLRFLGWTTLRLADIIDPAQLHIERQWKTSSRSLFTIVIARNAKALRARATPSLTEQAEFVSAP
jgi:phosphatidylethanolamine/phosphatidyl-N-methylethanolamine N-methyltransferase